MQLPSFVRAVLIELSCVTVQAESLRLTAFKLRLWQSRGVTVSGQRNSRGSLPWSDGPGRPALRATILPAWDLSRITSWQVAFQVIAVEELRFVALGCHCDRFQLAVKFMGGTGDSRLSVQALRASDSHNTQNVVKLYLSLLMLRKSAKPLLRNLAKNVAKAS